MQFFECDPQYEELGWLNTLRKLGCNDFEYNLQFKMCHQSNKVIKKKIKSKSGIVPLTLIAIIEQDKR